MNKALELMLKLKKTSGTNDKIKLISDYKDEKYVVDIFEFVFDKEFSSGISVKTLKKEEFHNGANHTNILDLMFFIRKNNTGSNYAISTVQKFVKAKLLSGEINEEEKEIIYEIVAQDLKIGISEKGINKAIPDLLMVFEPMLAFKLEDLKEKEITALDKEELYATLKLDGNRVLIYCFEDGRKHAVSRTGKRVEGLDELMNGLELPYKGYIYDGEVLADVEGSSMEQYDATSTIMRTKGKKKNLKFHIFDLCPIEEFKKGESSAPYSIRRDMLDGMKDNQYQKIVPVIGVYNINDEELYTRAKEYMDKGEEGLMINTGTGKYKTGRVKTIIKLKKFQECDILCTGVVEGEGELKGNLGAVRVLYKGKECTVGSGFKSKWKIDPRTRQVVESNIGSAIRREDIWQDPSLIIGKIVTIRYMEETKDGMMRMPRIKDIREDKTEPSYN